MAEERRTLLPKGTPTSRSCSYVPKRFCAFAPASTITGTSDSRLWSARRTGGEVGARRRVASRRSAQVSGKKGVGPKSRKPTHELHDDEITIANQPARGGEERVGCRGGGRRRRRRRGLSGGRQRGRRRRDDRGRRDGLRGEDLGGRRAQRHGGRGLRRGRGHRCCWRELAGEGLLSCEGAAGTREEDGCEVAQGKGQQARVKPSPATVLAGVDRTRTTTTTVCTRPRLDRQTTTLAGRVGTLGRLRSQPRCSAWAPPASSAGRACSLPRPAASALRHSPPSRQGG